jgi:hypothetical protein
MNAFSHHAHASSRPTSSKRVEHKASDSESGRAADFSVQRERNGESLGESQINLSSNADHDMKGGTNEMPYQHERILSGIMGKGEIVGAGENWQYAPRFVVLTESQLSFAAFQGVSYGEGGLPENYPITTGMARQKFDEFDIETGKTGFLTLQAARQCLETLLLAGSIQENGELPENPGMKWDRA